MSILETLWNGKIYPGEQYVRDDERYTKALQKAADQRERMESVLTPEQIQSLDMLLDAQDNAAAIAERDASMTGFRLAVWLMADAMGSMPG